MVQLSLPKNSKLTSGKNWSKTATGQRLKTFKIYRYDPTDGGNPQWDSYSAALVEKAFAGLAP